MMKNPHPSRRRVYVLLGFFCAFLVLFFAVLYDAQVVHGSENRARSITSNTASETVTASRGIITDRNGKVLVSNRLAYTLVVDKSSFGKDEAALNDAIWQLIQLCQEQGVTWNDTLPMTTGSSPQLTSKSLTESFREYLDDNKLPTDGGSAEVLAAMRKLYKVDDSYTDAQARLIVGVRYELDGRSSYTFAEDVSTELLGRITDGKYRGVTIKTAAARVYNTKLAAHILGTVGAIWQEEWRSDESTGYVGYADKGNNMNDLVGKDGVEKAFEEYLHGKDGEVEETRNASGTILSTVYTKEPEPGNNVYLTIDINLQEAVERVLDAGVNALIRTRENEKMEQTAKGLWTFEDGKYEITGAAAVVVNVKTGEPLAIASWPTYDVTTIIENYADLMKAENTPLFNRALMGAYAPGSTFKPCTAIAALTSDKVDLDTSTEIKCEGVFTKYAADGYAPECWIWAQGYTHPLENVTTALRDSCNYFFYTIGHDLGIDTLGEYAHALGLGVSTGIELVETTGNMSNAANHMDYAGSEWRIGDTLQAAIGQSDSVFTPLQLAEYCAAVANNGERHSASILKSIRNYDYSEKVYERQDEVLSTVESPQYNWDAIHEGMKEVINSPLNETNYLNFYDCAVTVAGKTGTAQKGEGIKNDGLFICYAPYEDPEIAVAVVVERGHAGASVGFIARQIVDVYLNIRSYSNTSESEMSLLK